MVIESCVWLLTSRVMVRISSQSNWNTRKVFGILKDTLCVVQRPKLKVSTPHGVVGFAGQPWAVKAVEGTIGRSWIHVYGCLLSFRYQAQGTNKE